VLYAYSQHYLSILTKQLPALPILDKLVDRYENATNEYLITYEAHIAFRKYFERNLGDLQQSSKEKIIWPSFVKFSQTSKKALFLKWIFLT